MTKIAIIGAGLAGLSLAHELKAIADVELFEKSWRAGGRVTSRIHATHCFDHGAQFFTVRSAQFKDFLQPLLAQGKIAPWHARFVEIDKSGISHARQWDDDYPHFVGVPNMSEIGSSLAEGLTIHYEKKICRLEKVAGQWQLADETALHAGFDWVILAIPPAQAWPLVKNHMPSWEAISTCQMQACYSLMLGLQNDIDLGWDAALVREHDISWISVNSSKPGSRSDYALLVHATNKWADQNLTMPLDAVTQHLQNEVFRVTGLAAQDVKVSDIHRWLYANLPKHEKQSYVDANSGMALCGDWCIQGRVEAAYMSAISLVEELKERVLSTGV